MTPDFGAACSFMLGNPQSDVLFLHYQPAAGGPAAPMMPPMMGQPMMGQPMMRPPFTGVAGAAPGAAAPGAPVTHLICNSTW